MGGADPVGDPVRVREHGRGELSVAFAQQGFGATDPGVRRAVRLGGGVPRVRDAQPVRSGVLAGGPGHLAPATASWVSS